MARVRGAVVGDAGFSSTHTLNVEGVPYWTSRALAANQYALATHVVVVSDGRLTLDPGNAPDRSTRVNYVEITPIGGSIELFPLASADVTIDGKPRKVVAVPSKQSWLYVFDRVTGEPIWPIEEKPVPAGNVPGEW